MGVQQLTQAVLSLVIPGVGRGALSPRSVFAKLDKLENSNLAQ